MEQKITFEDGKLVLLTDNGKISSCETTSQVRGTFTVTAKDAEVIAQMLAGKRFVRITYTSSIDGQFYWKAYDTNDEKIERELQDLTERCQELQDSLCKNKYYIARLRDLVKIKVASGRKDEIFNLCIAGALAITGIASLILSYWLTGATLIVCAFGSFATYKLAQSINRKLQDLLKEKE